MEAISSSDKNLSWLFENQLQLKRSYKKIKNSAQLAKRISCIIITNDKSVKKVYL